MNNLSFSIAKSFLGKSVRVIFDRPLGTKHPKHGFTYELNYGYIPGTIAPDGEALDAYYLGVNKPLLETDGVCIAIIHREDDDDDKLVVAPQDTDFTDDEILLAVAFQEKWFKHKVFRQ